MYPPVQWDGTDRWASSMDCGTVAHVYPLVQWDRTDRWDSSMDCGTVGQSVRIPCVPIGTVGSDIEPHRTFSNYILTEIAI